MVHPKDSPEVLARFEELLPLVDIIARQVSRSLRGSTELDELLSLGRMGLLEAARRFDPSRGVPFRAFANYRIRGAMMDGVRAMAQLPRRVHNQIKALAAAARYSEGAAEDVLAQPGPPTTAHKQLNDHLAGMATAMALGLVSETAHGEEGERVGVAPAADPESTAERRELLELIATAIDELPEQEAELVRRHYFSGERFDHVAKDLGLSKSWASRLHTRAIGRLSKRLRNRVK